MLSSTYTGFPTGVEKMGEEGGSLKSDGKQYMRESRKGGGSLKQCS